MDTNETTNPHLDPSSDISVEQAITAFGQTLKNPHHYLRVVRQYLLFTVRLQLPIGETSLNKYFDHYAQTRNLTTSITSPLRKFVRFAAHRGIEFVVKDQKPAIAPHSSNEFVIGFLSSLDGRRSLSTQKTYKRVLNLYFAWLDGHDLAFADTSTEAYLRWLRSQGLALSTVNSYLSVIKQLARWAAENYSELSEISDAQLSSLHRIQYLRGPSP